ncbi:hypothetical protein LSUCC1028_00325 [Rhodobacterales bacterium LSUCC1028]|nr:hypothetical protein [Rhodobacterales bacterium LSUCC1028]
MKKIICVALFMSSTSPIYADQSVITISEFPHETLSALAILQHWPVCSFSSSLGQVCRAYWEDKEPNGFLEVLVEGRLDEGYPKLVVEMTETVLDITVEDKWFYSFMVDQTGANEFQVVFTDDSLMGSYLARTEYTVIIEEDIATIREGATQTW